MSDHTNLFKCLDCPTFQFAGGSNGAYDRHLLFDNIINPTRAHTRQKYESLAHSIRDLLTQRWIKTRAAHSAANPKRIYYLSMEFLIGRSLTNNITNLA